MNIRRPSAGNARRPSALLAVVASSLLAVLTAPASAPAAAETTAETAAAETAPQTAAAQTTPPELPTLLGWAAGTGTAFREQLPQIKQQAGKTPALSMVSFRIGTNHGGGDTDWGQKWIPGLMTDLTNLGTVPYLELETSNVAALADGRLDGEIDRMVGTLGGWLRGDASRRLLVAPLPEMNLQEHQWGLQPTAYKRSYHRIRGAFFDAGVGADQIRFVFAPNGLSSEGAGSYPKYYPGDGAVDLVGFAKLNRGTPWRDYAETFQRHIDEMRRTVTTSKPILITQTASVTSGGNRAAWLHDMFTRLDAHDQVIGAVYFNRDKDHDYRVLVDGRLDPTFRDDYRTYWSAPSQVSFLYDGSLDAWVTARGGTPAARFADTARSPFLPDIEWVADAGITAGCSPDHYCPSHAVTRAQMATFLARALDLPAASRDHFADDEGNPHEQNINRVAEAGITAGCDTSGTRFCPSATVNRAQMASFLAAAFELPAASRDYFSDDRGLHHEDNINRVTEAGIANGCTADRYCPGNAVNRGQMAAFLHRALA